MNDGEGLAQLNESDALRRGAGGRVREGRGGDA